MDMPVKLTNAVFKTRAFVEVFEYNNTCELTKSLFELYDTLNMANHDYVARSHTEVPPEAWEDPECEFWNSEESLKLVSILTGRIQMKSPNEILWCKNPDRENSFGFMRSMSELKHWW